MSENAVSGHIQLIIPGETACFAVGTTAEELSAMWYFTGNVKCTKFYLPIVFNKCLFLTVTCSNLFVFKEKHVNSV